MDTQQIQIILTAIKSATDAGLHAFIWWLIFDKALGPITWLITFYGAYRVAMRFVRANDDTANLERWAKTLNITYYGPLSDRERAETIAKIDSLINNWKSGSR